MPLPPPLLPSRHADYSVLFNYTTQPTILIITLGCAGPAEGFTTFADVHLLFTMFLVERDDKPLGGCIYPLLHGMKNIFASGETGLRPLEFCPRHPFPTTFEEWSDLLVLTTACWNFWMNSERREVTSPPPYTRKCRKKGVTSCNMIFICKRVGAGSCHPTVREAKTGAAT